MKKRKLWPISKTLLSIAVVALVAPLFIGTTAQAQDLGVVLDAMQEIEVDLKALIASESSERQKAIEQLRADVANLPAGEAAASGIPEAEWAALLNDIEFLKAENLYLRGLVGKNSEQWASAETGYPDQSETIERLSTAITALNERLEEAVANRPSGARSTDVAVDHDFVSSIEFSGFVDASDFNDHNSGESSFGLDQVEVDVMKDFSGQASLRADIEYVSDGMGNFDLDLEQGYVTYSFGHHQKWSFSFGKFNAPIGFELLDAPDMYQYSHALVFDNGLPTNLTGIMMSTEFPAIVDWTLYIVNGWDVNTDNNKDKTIGTRIGFTPIDNLNWGVSLISGPELDDDNSRRRTVLDFDLTWNPMDIWTVGGEFNLGMESDAVLNDDGVTWDNGKWNGFLLMSNVALGDRFGLTTRFDFFNDADGLRTGDVHKWKAVCVSPSISIVDGLGGLIELRYDWSNEDVFTGHDGQPKDNSFSSALEFTYGF